MIEANGDTTGSLAEGIKAILAGLGGRYAVSARRVRTHPAIIPAHIHQEHGESGPTERGAEDHVDHVALHAGAVFPAASLAKLCIGVELFRRAELGQFELNERFDTALEPRVGGGGVLDYLDPSTLLTLNELAFLMLAISDNTAANFLLDLVGMGEVNETMSRLNLAKTKLARHFMDFAARAVHRDNVTSADDMVSLLILAYGNTLPGARRLLELLALQQVADDLRAWLPESAQLSHKTGALDDSGSRDGVFHDAGILSGPSGRSCVFAVLTAEQRDLPAARNAVGLVLRTLWDTWCSREH